MNKRGVNSLKFLLYSIASLLVSGMVFAIFILTLPNAMKGSVEDVLAKDVALSISMISSAPHDIVYFYEENTEKYEVIVNQEEVIVKSDKGSGSYKYMPMQGVTVKDADIQDVLSIPLNFKNNVLSFSNDQQDFTDLCSQIPKAFDGDYINVKILIGEDESPETTQILEVIKERFERSARSSADERIIIVDDGEDLLLVLSTSKYEEANIKYFENNEEPETAWYHRLACYMEREIKRNNEQEFGTIYLTQISEQNTIKLVFGEPEKFVKSSEENPTLKFALSDEIYQSIISMLDE